MKFFNIICCTLIICTQSALSLWDFAVTTKSKIIFYDDQWREVSASAHQFDDLSAIAFDETEEVIYFNDKLHNNGSIFSLKIPSLQNDPHIFEHIVQRTQEEWINGLAYDPLNRNLYWTDARNKKIFFQSIDGYGTARTPQVLVDFADGDAVPYGIAVDICRRKLYWTNSNFKNATIERIELDGSQREVIVRSDLYLPRGIVVDQLSDRIFWVVDQQGSHFSVESANFDGSDRQIIVKALDNVPFNLAVTKNAIFWTDSTHNAVWSHSKYAKTNESETLESVATSKSPHKVATLAESPRGIVSRLRWLKSLENDQHCSQTVRKLKTRLLTPKPTRSSLNEHLEQLRREHCLNDGEFSEVSGMCICKSGYDGVRCETNECHNFCVHGTCKMDSMGFPKCTCQQGFHGERCQSFKCNNYCLNGGVCKLTEHTNEPRCECQENFGGEHCEQNSTEICALFCRILKHDPDTYVPFGCHDICEELAEQSEEGSTVYAIPKFKHLEVCPNTWNTSIVVIVCGVVACLSLVLLIVHGLRRFYKPARPRIRKTFVVKKQAGSDTPLTNRPLATEQCEITIENCCNMNICDTPCFDPKLLQQNMARDSNTKEDKKMLIKNMDCDLY